MVNKSLENIPKAWCVKALEEVTEVVIDYRGKTPKKLGGDWSSSGYRALSAKNIKKGELINEEDIRCVDKTIYEDWMKCEIQKEDILLTSEAPLGEYLFWNSDEKIVLSQRLFGIRVNKKKVYPKYFYFFVGSRFYQHELKKRESGSTVSGIRQVELLKTNVILPPLSEQKAIADVLSSLDDKIKLLQKQNKTLEAIAQALFKRWFVDFEFPNEEGKPHESKFSTLGEEFDISIGRTPSRQEIKWFSTKPTGKKWISIKDLGNTETYIFNTSEYLIDGAIEQFNIPIIPSNTTVLSFKLTVGRVAITTEAMLSNEAIAHIKIKKGSIFTTEYIYLFLKTLNFADLGSTSSIADAINSTTIKNITIAIPEETLMQRFNELIKPIFKKLKNNGSQIQALSNTRNVLLPKLMSGEVRVKNT